NDLGRRPLGRSLDSRLSASPRVARIHRPRQDQPRNQEARVSEVFVDPTPDELRTDTEAMPECRITGFRNVNVQTRVVSRSAGSTFVVDRPSSGKTMTRDAYVELARRQDDYVASHDHMQIDSCG